MGVKNAVRNYTSIMIRFTAALPTNKHERGDFMKSKMKLLGFSIFAAVIGLLLAGCASSDKKGGNTQINLDKAISEAAVRIDERVDARSKIALLNFSSPTEQFSSYVLDELTANLLDSGKLTIVDRKEVDLIRGEFNFQFSGEVGDDSMQELGRMLGAQAIVSGSLTEIGNAYRIVIRVLNVQSAAVIAQYRSDINNDSRVKALLSSARRDNSAAGAAFVQWLLTP